MHEYRDPDVPEGRILGLGIAGMVVLPFALVALNVFLGDGLTWGFLRFSAPIFALAFLFACLTYRHFAYGLCKEIRLSDDGTCELTTWRRVIRLHVNEIKSVKYRRDSEDESESYTIGYTGGKISVRDHMTNFPDFLFRLKALNPALDLTSFPSAGWTPRTTASERPGARLTIRNSVFPLVVTAIIAWLALETLTGG